MEQRSTQHQLDKQKKNDWFLRFIKGMFIGSGFILPGVSGGALAAIFGLYERMIAFLATSQKTSRRTYYSSYQSESVHLQVSSVSYTHLTLPTNSLV